MIPQTNPTPHKAVHPGLHLKEALVECGIKQNELAAEIGIQPSQINEILKGKRPITPDLAILFGAALDSSAEWWNTLQANYNLELAKVEESTKKQVEAIETWKNIKKYVPISYFKKEDILSGHLVKDINKLLDVLEFSSVHEMEENLNKNHPNGIHFKKSGKLLEHASHVNSWIRYVRHISLQDSVSKFDFECEKDLKLNLKKVFNGTNVKENVTSLLSSYGIKFIIKSKPDHAPLDGAAFWENNNPVIALTLRYQRYDNFIFTLYHELGHVFLHLKNNKSASFVDSLEDDSTQIDVKEEQANEFAREILIPNECWKEFVFGKTKFSDENIKDFADSMGIPPQSVWGRLCFDGRIKYSSASAYQRDNKIP